MTATAMTEMTALQAELDEARWLLPVYPHTPVEPVRGDDRCTDRARQRSPRVRRADPEVEGIQARVAAVEPEHLARDAELEHGEPLDERDRDTVDHGIHHTVRIFANTVWMPPRGRICASVALRT